MQEVIKDRVAPAALRDRNDPWWVDTKASDDFLDRLFVDFFERMGLPNLMNKTHYHTLAPYVARELLDPEIREVLDMMVKQAAKARPQV